MRRVEQGLDLGISAALDHVELHERHGISLASEETRRVDSQAHHHEAAEPNEITARGLDFRSPC
jgi:hypothetical protein